MSSNETTPFMFDIQESLSFRADAQLQDLIGIALEPEISIQEFEHEISVRGVIELTGEYYPIQEVAEGSAVAVSPGTREMENIEKQEAGTNTFYHRFPVEISVPKNRIKQLNDVYVTIDNFDYEVPGSNVLELHATVAIYGVLEERKQAQPQAPQQPYFPPPIPQAEQAKSYTDEIANQIEAQARDNQQYEQQGYQFAKEEPAEAKSEESSSYATDEIDAEQQSYQISQDEYVEEAEVVENREETEADARDEYETDDQSYQFTQNEYPEEEVEVNREETEAGARDEYETDEQSYQFTQDVYAEEEVEVNKEETEADARDEYESEEQSYQFAQDYVEQKEAEVQDDQDAGGQGYQFSGEYTETEVEAELKAETRDQKTEEQSIPFTQEYAEQPQAEARPEESEASVASASADIEQRPSEEEQEEPQAFVQDQAPAYPKVTIQAEKPAENSREEAVYEAEELSHLQNAHQNPEANKLPEEFFVLPDELEDAYQAADFRQAHIQDDDVYYLDRELPHEEPSDTPDFTFTYQAKQEEAPPEPIRFEAPPLLTPEEDDRWKYKETKTFSEFFGSKPVEPTEVPQADVTAEEVNTEESYEDAYKDVSLQAVPINQELQPEDLPEVIEEETEEASERKDSSNFLVSMFGAREETYTKLRVCIVQERDTLEKIATRYDVPISSIASSNNLDEETVSEGQLLLIPQRRSKKN
ncbi:LysM peptidoglycan-binding domain-containing protein [Terribacillus saccharophilus]|uniref:LysM peptidoglycan-binding domain-containing protein n=1 Tax=Terribacillus saccharophilus TaxID=361277 RepID=UPI002DC9DF73|nr:LysM peptidoglycan-binding domain-containing protein [Terribacillus saccharophilus]MEC0290779.1 LysM peptidoglycan-binding domain-containing protein [Terribacillus saccharophilus]